MSKKYSIADFINTEEIKSIKSSEEQYRIASLCALVHNFKPHPLRDIGLGLLYMLRVIASPVTQILSYTVVALGAIMLAVAYVLKWLGEWTIRLSGVVATGEDYVYGENPIKAIKSDCNNIKWHLFKTPKMKAQWLADVLSEDDVPKSLWPERIRGFEQSEKSKREVAEREAADRIEKEERAARLAAAIRPKFDAKTLETIDNRNASNAKDKE